MEALTRRPRSPGGAGARGPRRKLSLALALPALALAAGAGPAHGQIDGRERAIAEWVSEHADEALAHLRRSVDINSGTMNAAGVRAVADELIPAFVEIGFDARWVPEPEALNRSGHLVAERVADDPAGARLLLIGHLDTVFEEDSPFQTYEVVDDTTVRGPGVEDMKGGNIAILYALKALHAVGALEGTTIRVVMTGDEEDPGRPLADARAALIDAARASDLALGFESGSSIDGQEVAVVARRGATKWMLRVGGRPNHSSTIFKDDVGAGAIFEAARILDGFYSHLRGEQYLTFNPGVILGGTAVEYDAREVRGTVSGKTNIVAQDVVVHGGIRTISTDQLERAQERMRAIVAQSLPHTSATIEFDEGYPPMPPTDGNVALLERLSEVSVDLGYGPIQPHDPGARGAADVSFVAPFIDGIDGLGPHGSGGHTTDETMDVRTLPRAIARAAVLILRLTAGAAS
ncbi:MAG TPA: M20/M25/M40 family metallo-hydrolase [Longimicrobiales bacterium]|nr:M20/M25/M40 family metallo-hydrolase [Longimicrobiales bacterium]